MADPLVLPLHQPRPPLRGAEAPAVEHQRVALQKPPRARRQRAAVFRADGAGPNHVEVPQRERRVVVAPDVAQDGGLKFSHDVQGLKALPPDLVPQKSSRSLGIFKEQDRHYDEDSHVHRTGLFSHG